MLLFLNSLCNRPICIHIHCKRDADRVKISLLIFSISLPQFPATSASGSGGNGRGPKTPVLSPSWRRTTSQISPMLTLLLSSKQSSTNHTSGQTSLMLPGQSKLQTHTHVYNVYTCTHARTHTHTPMMHSDRHILNKICLLS